MSTSTVTTEAPSASSSQPRLRRLRDGDDAQVRRIFRETVALGRPLPFDHRGAAPYEDLCVGWYLRHAREHAWVVEVDGRVGGYLLACLDQVAATRWGRRRAARWTGGELLRIATGQVRREARTFSLLRMRDGWRTLRRGAPLPAGAHAHINLDPELRGHWIAHRLVARMDEMVAQAGLDGWFGEVNMPRGRDLSGLEAAGARVGERMPNATLSWLAGHPIQRCTVIRMLDERTDLVLDS